MALKGPPAVETRYVQGGIGNGWSIPAGGGEVTWHPPFGDATYTWNMPETIPAAGAKVTLTVTAHAVEGQRFAPAMAIAGGPVKESKVQVGPLAESGQTVKATKTATLVPVTGTQTVVVGIQDGPTYTYTYVPGIEEIVVSLAYSVPPPGTGTSSGHVTLGTAVQLETTAEPPPTSGIEIVVYAKIQGDTKSGKTGTIVAGSVCAREHCTSRYTQRVRPVVVAFRAFAVRGHVGTPGYKVLGTSNPVVITWAEPKIGVELLVQTAGDEPYAASGRATAGGRVRLRADLDAPLPPGTQLRIEWRLEPRGEWRPVPVECARTACTGFKQYNLPATLGFRAVVERTTPASTRTLSQSKLVRVTWAKS